MTSPAVGRGVGKAHTLENTRFVSGRLQALHVDRNVFKSPRFACFNNSLGEYGSDSLSKCYFLKESGNAIHIAIIDFFVDYSSSRGFNRESGKITSRNGVHPETIADVV